MDVQRKNGAPVGEEMVRTVLFTDVARSTEILDALGDDGWFVLIDHHRRTMDAVISHHAGRLVGFSGDGYLGAFRYPWDGVSCALRLQLALTVQAELHVRIGVCSGPVRRLERHYTGLTVHLASRLTDMCEAGEVLIAEHTYLDARFGCALPELERRVVDVRGLNEPRPVRCVRPIRAS